MKRIISCAITGSIHSPSMSPYLPVTTDQIAQNAIDAANAGAASVHIHARIGEGERYGAPSSRIEDFQAIVDKIRTVNKDVIICVTTGVRWSSMTTTCRPLLSLKVVGGFGASVCA